MNQSRYLLLCALLAFLPLGVVVVRSSLPHPEAEGDRWLWERAEQGTSLIISTVSLGQQHPQPNAKQDETNYLTTSERRNIRAVIQAFVGTPAFASCEGEMNARKLNTCAAVAFLIVEPEDPAKGDRNLVSKLFCLVKQGGNYILYRYSDGGYSCAPTNIAAVQRFLQVVKALQPPLAHTIETRLKDVSC